MFISVLIPKFLHIKITFSTLSWSLFADLTGEGVLLLRFLVVSGVQLGVYPVVD